MIDDISLEILRILQEKAASPTSRSPGRSGWRPRGPRTYPQDGETRGDRRLRGPAQSRAFRQQPDRLCPGHRREQPDEPNIGEQLARIPEIQEVHYIAGEDCYLIKIRAADTVELGRLLRTRVTAIPGVLATRTAPVLATYKETAVSPSLKKKRTGPCQCLKTSKTAFCRCCRR